MSTVVDLRTEVIHRMVFELRFDFGQVYWDRAGRIAKEILSNREEWDFDRIDINHCQLAHRDLNLAFNFGHAKLDLSQTQNADVEELVSFGEFGALADTIASTVVDYLELDSFPRMGFRVWRLYPSADREQSHGFVRQLQLFSLHEGLSDSVGEISEISHRLVTEREKHMVRVAVAPFEQQIQLPPSVIREAKLKAHQQPAEQRRHSRIDRRRQILIDQMKAKKKIAHYPQFGLLLDLDAYIEDPPFPDDLTISDFIASATEDFQQLRAIVLAAQDK